MADKVKYPVGLEVPCGKCLLCRISKRKEWVLRIFHEADYWDKKSFVTLTYNDENIPKGGSLVKADLQNFFKRLRKCRYENGKSKIKYYACGEYGDRTYRPHYHVLFFGIGTDDRDIEENWRVGHCHVGSVSIESIRYVAGYVNKKYGEHEKGYEFYKKNGLERPFQLLSKGIGKQFAMDNRDQIVQQQRLTLNGSSYSIPRYYVNKLEIDISKRKEEIRQKELERNSTEFLLYKTFEELKLDFDNRQISSEEYFYYLNLFHESNKQRELNHSTKNGLKEKKL